MKAVPELIKNVISLVEGGDGENGGWKECLVLLIESRKVQQFREDVIQLSLNVVNSRIADVERTFYILHTFIYVNSIRFLL